MRTKNRLLSTILIAILTFVMAIPAAAFADNEKGNQWKEDGKPESSQEKEHGQPEFVKKKLELKGFEFVGDHKIRVNKNNVKFDVPPVIKEGRTLIPVRAVTEAMGAKVEYDEKTAVVTITSADGKTVIMFYLAESDNGKITVTKDGVTKDVTTDVRPGIINNRTFVPLRFISETLGLKVSHDEKTGDIDIDDDEDNDGTVPPVITPVLSPNHVSFANREVLTAVTFSYSNDAAYDLLSIQNQSVAVTTGSYSVVGNAITLQKAYLESLTADKTVLTLTFNKTADTASTVQKTFEININQSGVYEKPVISPLGVKYYSAGEIADAIIAVDWNDHTLKEIKNADVVLTPGTAYVVDGNKIIVKKAYIQGLPTGQTVLTLVFEAADKEPVSLSFTIEK